MRRMNFVLLATSALAAVAGAALASGEGDLEPAPIYGITLPEEYRDWRLISVAREQGSLDDIRAVLGNDIAIQAAREGRLPYPDGTIIARIAWSYDPLAESEEAFGSPQSFVAGHPKNGVQFMVKDSARFATTGGWGFAHFDDGRPASEAVHDACFACHTVVAERDFVFARYAH